MRQFTFRKTERLKKEKHIQELFSKGSSFYLFPFKVLVLPAETGTAVHQVVVSVSKKNFPRAVDRNYLKRRIREGYRIEKVKLSPGTPLHIGLIFTHKELMPYQEISNKMVHVIKRINKVREGILKHND